VEKRQVLSWRRLQLGITCLSEAQLLTGVSKYSTYTLFSCQNSFNSVSLQCSNQNEIILMNDSFRVTQNGGNFSLIYVLEFAAVQHCYSSQVLGFSTTFGHITAPPLDCKTSTAVIPALTRISSLRNCCDRPVEVKLPSRNHP